MRRLTILTLLILAFSTGLFALEYIRPYKKGNKIIFSFTDPQNKVKRAFLAGSINDWNFRMLPLQKTMIGNRFFIALELQPGRYEYKYLVNSFVFQDMSNPLSVDDGRSRANSIIYISSNGQLDWDHQERANVLEDGTWQIRETFPVELKGYYTVQNLTLRLTNMTVSLKDGWGRLATTEKGVTGLIFRGKARLDIAGKERQEGSGVFLRFHPRLYEEKLKSQLIKTNQQPEHMYCNNLFYLKNLRFYYMAGEFMIPPEGFVGISLNNENYQGEKVFTAFQNTFYDPTRPVFSRVQAVEEDVTTSTKKGMLPLFEQWMSALSAQDVTLVQDLLYNSIYKGVAQTAMSMDRLKGSTFDKSSLKVIEIKTGAGMNRLESPRYISATIKTVDGKVGRTRIMVALFKGEWKIVNYTLSF